MKSRGLRGRRFLGIILVLAVLLAGYAWAADESWEAGAQTSAGAVLWKMTKRVPEIWKLKAEAKKVAKTLPEYPGEVAVPDSATIFSWIQELCRNPHRRPGTEYDHQAEIFVAAKMKEFGLENVTLDPVPMTVWTAQEWSLTVKGEKIPSFFVVNTGFTSASGVSAPLVYVGAGEPEVWKKTEVKDKIVVADVTFPYLPAGGLMKLTGSSYVLSDPDHSITLATGQYLNFVRQNFIGGTTPDQSPASDVYGQAFRRGAKGILLILRDQPSGSNSHYGPYDGIMKPLPALWIGKYDGVKLREIAKQGASATLTLTGDTAPGVMHNVWGTLPGMSDEVILVTSHHDSPFTGATEDGAGSAQVLAQAWAWSKVPQEKRPKTMIFVLDGGHFYGSLGGHTFAREHQDIMKRAKIVITLEHLGAKEVAEKDRKYAETGRLAFTVMFTSPKPEVIAVVMKAAAKQPPKVTAAIPADFFGPAPTSDAAGYVLESNVPVISWIGCPYYLLDEFDTLDKISQPDLHPIALTVTEMVKTFMAMK